MIEAQNRVPLGTPDRAYRRRRIVPLLLAFTDVGTVYLAFIAAYWVRYSLEIGPSIQDRVSFAAYQPLAIVLLGVMIPVLAVKGAYRTRMGTEVVDELTAIFSSATITVASVVVVSFMAQQYAYSRGVIIYLWVSLIVLSFWRGYCLEPSRAGVISAGGAPSGSW